MPIVIAEFTIESAIYKRRQYEMSAVLNAAWNAHPFQPRKRVEQSLSEILRAGVRRAEKMVGVGDETRARVVDHERTVARQLDVEKRLLRERAYR